MIQLEETLRSLLPTKWKRYPAYKDSGIGWLGEIPEHWEVRKLKYLAQRGLINGLFKKRDQFGRGVKLINVVNMYQEHFHIDFESLDRVEAEQQEIDAFAVLPGDIFFVRSSLKLEGVGVSACAIEIKEPTVFECHLVGLRLSNHLLPEYAINYLNSSFTRQHLVALAETTTMTTIAQPKLASLEIIVPPLPEQQAIVTYLDKETAKIDTLIAKKEQLIALLQEKRAALISHAVTKGLDAAVPMKDSGIEWLGEIPEHWDMRRFKFCLRSIEQGWSPECENRRAEPDEWGVLKVGCVNGTKFNQLENKALPSAVKPLPELEIKSGDILMSRANTRELLGSASIVERVRPRLILCDKLYRLKLLPKGINSTYLVLLLRSSLARFQFERAATGASNSMQNISQEIILNLILPLPDQSEQQAIVACIDKETARIDALISTIREAIKKLEEYSTALISAAVTGKIDVRGVDERGDTGT